MRLLSVSLCFLLLVAAPSLGATITVVNLDGPGEGFNDPTPRVPVGGNVGVTLGQQRLIAFEHAADIWGALLQSAVEIRVGANFDPLSCDAFGATLGGAGPETVHRDFANAPVANTWYPQALANSLAGVDLDAATNDIFATFNSVIGTTCPFPNGWYYGLDESPPGSDVDFASVVLHEIGHGLGFLTLVAQLGTKFNGFDDMYMLNLEDHSTGVSYPAMTDGERATANVDDGDLHWTGASVVANGAALSSGREPISGHVEIYAPNPFEGGSSVAHFSTSLFPNEAMEPFYTGAVHDPNLAADLMYDIGWLPNDCGNGLFDGAEECDDGNTVSGDGCSRCLIDECSSCVGEPSVCTPETGTACDDGQACTTSDLCQAGACVGAATPLTGCLVGTQAGKGLLLLKDKTSDQSDKLIWKFLKGEETTVGDFGTPSSGTDFLMCVYDKTGGQDTVVMSLEIPDGGDWDVKTTGFKYSDKAASSDGVKIALLKAGTDGKAKIIVKGKGVGLPMTDLSALDLPLTVQLSNGSQCWESTYQSNVQSSTAESFKAKAD